MRTGRKRKQNIAKAAVLFLLLCVLGSLAFLRNRGAGTRDTDPVPAETGNTIPVTDTAVSAQTQAPAGKAADAEPAAESADYSGQVRISELMSKNRSAALSPSGDFCDWLEIENISGETLSLDGWTAGTAENGKGIALDGTELQPGGYCVIFTADRQYDDPFTFGNGDTVCLRSPDGSVQDSVIYVAGDEANTSYALNTEGAFTSTRLATPGYENSDSGYCAYMDSRAATGPIIINEVTVSNSSAAPQENGEYCDWIELKNISSQAVDLSDYYLSDSRNNYFKYRLPDALLQPGEYYLVWCGNDIDDARHTGFGLNTCNENLYLCDGTQVLDYIFLHDIPVDGSCGRMDGSDGLFYFVKPTPYRDNTNGFRLVSERPGVSVPAGAYDDVESLTVELTGGGTVYYTLDGSEPTTRSAVYNGPLTFDRNTILRAFRVEEGRAPSRTASFTYLINENISLPLLSLIVEDYDTFCYIYNRIDDKYECAANLTLYNQDGTGFSADCGVSLKGRASLADDKKSFNIDFRGRYGDSKLTGVDIFGNGITEFDKLCIRSGQDYIYSVIRNELCENMALALPDSHILTQASQYCVLYINGEYRGIYALMEEKGDRYYAAHYGVDKDTVEILCTEDLDGSDYYTGVLDFIYNNDLSVQENYDYICSVIDIDNYIDWMIMEGWSANDDTARNIRYFKSPEDGLWRVYYFDLDWAFWWDNCLFENVFHGAGKQGEQMTALIGSLMNSPEFRERFLNRFAEAMSTTLSSENVLAEIDRMSSLIAPEIKRNHEYWGLDPEDFPKRIDALKALFVGGDWDRRCIEEVCGIFGITVEYFNAEYMAGYSS